MTTKPDYLTVQLVGGLGNQLFGYVAGLAHARRFNRTVYFDVSRLSKGFTDHGSDLRSFDLEGTFTLEPKTLHFLRKLVTGLGVICPPIATPLQNAVGQWTAESVSQPIPDFPRHKKYLIRGYFQTRRYITELVDDGFAISLKTPSKWFQDLETDARRVRPIMMHVRRGDYLGLSEEIGLLDATYFVGALERVQSAVAQLEGREVWVFSDDIDMVMREFEGLSRANLKWINVPEDADDAESLLLMSLGTANIISNSTFSWWSAALNPKSVVVAPAKWFRGKDDPEDLIPESWIRLPSIWKD